MPYSVLSDLPKAVQHLPFHARKIYLKAFNNAWQEYANPLKRRFASTREVTARRVAWGAVKKSYQKSGNEWVKR